MKRPMKAWLVATIAVAMAGSALAAPVYTSVSSPPSGEDSHKTIIETVYGLSVSQSGLDWTGTNFTATRIADADTTATMPLALRQPDTAAGPFDDQSWHNGVVSFTAEAKFAAFNQTFGFDYNTSSGMQELFRTTGSGYSLTTAASGVGTQVGSAVEGLFTLAPLHWMRAGDGSSWTNNVQSSRVSDNSNGMDHMVTYLITDTRSGPIGPHSDTTWLVFWEDQRCGDWDYNDLVVEFRAEGEGIIPEPVTMLTLFGSVVCLGRYVRRRTV